MFFSKKSHQDEESVAKKSVRKVDTLVTGMILWGIIASIYGVKKLKDMKEEESQNSTHMLPKHEETPWEHPREKKQSLLSRILFGNE